MHKSESVLEMRHEILWDFEIQTVHQILVRRLNLELIKKKKIYGQTDFTFQQITKMEEKNKQLLRLSRKWE